jgi:hypothetical protein
MRLGYSQGRRQRTCERRRRGQRGRPGRRGRARGGWRVCTSRSARRRPGARPGGRAGCEYSNGAGEEITMFGG